MPILQVDTAADFSGMTIPALRAEVQRLGAVVAEAQRQRELIFASIEKRRAEVAARMRLAALTAIERDALRDVLQEPAP